MPAFMNCVLRSTYAATAKIKMLSFVVDGEWEVGMVPEVGGVPDGNGGTLPTIKQPLWPGRGGLSPAMVAGDTAASSLVPQQATAAHWFRQPSHHPPSSRSNTGPAPPQVHTHTHWGRHV